MPYAVIAPGISTVYDNWADVDRIYRLYTHPIFRKFPTHEQCWEYVRRHAYTRVYRDVNKYGETFSHLYVQMKYYIRKESVYYIFDTRKFGHIVIEIDDPNVEVLNKSNEIRVALRNICLNDDSISNHLLAIWHGLKILGEFIDVDVQVPDHSIFYALMTYNGHNRTINRVRTYVADRLGHVSVSLKEFYDNHTCT